MTRNEWDLSAAGLMLIDLENANKILQEKSHKQYCVVHVNAVKAHV